MKKRFNRNIYIILPWIITSAFLMHAAPQEWNSLQVSNVIDNDLIITSNVQLPQGGTTIQALSKDVHVHLETDILIQANNAGASQLYLNTQEGRTITVRLNKNLQFEGSSNDDQTPLLILQSGGGNVIWQTEGGNELAFTSGLNSGGTNYYLLINTDNEYSSLPEALFNRVVNRGINDQNTKITVGKKSLLGYVSASPLGADNARGAFVFDASNNGAGLMELIIDNQGAVIVSPRHIASSNPFATLNDISKGKLAGGQASFEVVNSKGSNASASLFVINKNKKMSEFLFDPFLNLNTRNASSSYTGSFKGKQYGFIVGSNGLLNIQDNANLNYVGLTANSSAPENICAQSLADKSFKSRNASALLFDQSHNPNAQAPQVLFGTAAALFLRSAVDSVNSSVRGPHSKHLFTSINTDLFVPGVGDYVLDIEGDVNVIGLTGAQGQNAKIELLSLEVAPTGGSLFVNTTESIFPTRTFAQNNKGELYRYNKGAFLINGHLNLNNVSLVHTDENSTVIENDDVNSEPVYVGGETFTLVNSIGASDLEKILMRPKISFVNSRFLFHTSAALTGVDLLVPNYVQTGDIGLKNFSEFLFAYNGLSVDNGVSRSLILGTKIGSTTQDNFTVISGDAHLDIIQTQDIFDLEVDPFDPQGDQTLILDTIANNDTIVLDIGNSVISGQFGAQTIYLGNNSNISIGTDANVTGFFQDTHPWLRVAGDFFTFSSAGGILKDPSTAVRTGTGGIFVDLNGKFSVDPLADVIINTVIARNYNGIIDIPANSVIFNSLVGVTNSSIDLSNPSSLTIIEANENFSDYTIDWSTVKKDFLTSTGGSYTPYVVGQNNLANSPAVVEANIANVPTIKGTVEQLQIIGSSLANPATIKIDGGNVGELIFLNTPDLTSAPIAIIVLENGGTIGLGSASRNSDSVQSSANIGQNGITIIANNGGGRVVLNDNIFIQGISPFLFGPDAQSGDVLQIVSQTDPAIFVNNASILDLRNVREGNIIEFAQKAGLVMRPASKIILGGGTIRFTDNAAFNFDTSNGSAAFFNAIPLGPIDNTLSAASSTIASAPHNEAAPLTQVANGLRNTDPYRVSIIGTGTVSFAGNAVMSLPNDTFLGVETLKQILNAQNNVVAEIPVTNILFELQDNANVKIGDQNGAQGGVLQVGNVENFGDNHSIIFNMTLNSANSLFEVGSKGVLGLNVGVVKAITNNVSDMLVDTLSNVSLVDIKINKGALNVSRIWDTDDARSNVVLIGDDGLNKTQFNLEYGVLGSSISETEMMRSKNANLQGGSPLVYILQAPQVGQTAGALAPIVRAVDNQIPAGTNADGSALMRPRYLGGMIASTLLQSTDATSVATNASSFFNKIKTQDAFVGFTPSHNEANAATNGQDDVNSLTSVRVGTVSQGAIIRIDADDIFTGSGEDQEEMFENVVDEGAVFVSIDQATNTIKTIAEIPA